MPHTIFSYHVQYVPGTWLLRAGQELSQVHALQEAVFGMIIGQANKPLKAAKMLHLEKLT